MEPQNVPPEIAHTMAAAAAIAGIIRGIVAVLRTPLLKQAWQRLPWWSKPTVLMGSTTLLGTLDAVLLGQPWYLALGSAFTKQCGLLLIEPMAPRPVASINFFGRLQIFELLDVCGDGGRPEPVPEVTYQRVRLCGHDGRTLVVDRVRERTSKWLNQQRPCERRRRQMLQDSSLGPAVAQHAACLSLSSAPSTSG